MTQYAPIWLTDTDDNSYHAKINAYGHYYIVDALMNKSLELRNLDKCPVGHEIDYPLFYNKYTVTKNELI